MDKLGYWTEMVESSLDEHGVSASAEQIAAIAKDMHSAHDSVGLAFHVPEHPLIREVKELTRNLETERSKVVCKECKGDGRLTFQGPIHGSNTECWVCHGEGYVVP